MVQLNEGLATKIVVSRWENGNSHGLVSPVQIVASPLPGLEKLNRLHNSQNIYLQATTVLAGLEKVDTPYVIKARSDEFFSNLALMVEAFNPKKLLFANIFIRDVSYRPYHISDHLFIGSTDRIKSAFISLKRYIENAGCGGGINTAFSIQTYLPKQRLDYSIYRHVAMKLIILWSFRRLRHLT